MIFIVLPLLLSMVDLAPLNVLLTSQSKLSRRVYNLEENLGVRLIQRSSPISLFTDIGMDIYRHAQVMMNAAQAAHDLVDHLSIQPRGVVKVSVPVDIAQNQLPKILPAF